MRLKRRKLIRKLKKNRGIFFVLLLCLSLAAVMFMSSAKPSSEVKQSNSTQSFDAEYVYTNICMRCHITPTKYQSFTTYFGKPASVWKIGVNKMVAAGNVKLKPWQVEEMANYLSKQFEG